MSVPFAKTWMLTVKGAGPRIDETLKHCKEAGIEVELFYGVDCKVSGLDSSHTYEIDHPGSGYRMGAKCVNLMLSHYIMWRCAWHSGVESVLILEDDVRFEADWAAVLDDCMAHIPQNWDILYLGSCCCKGKRNDKVHGRLHKSKYALCTHAYAIRRRAMEVLIEKCVKFWAPADIAMALEALPWLNAFVILPRIVNQHGTIIPP